MQRRKRRRLAGAGSRRHVRLWVAATTVASGAPAATAGGVRENRWRTAAVGNRRARLPAECRVMERAVLTLPASWRATFPRRCSPRSRSSRSSWPPRCTCRPWKGGGFGMFSTLDHGGFRGVDVVVDAPGRSEQVEIAASLQTRGGPGGRASRRLAAARPRGRDRGAGAAARAAGLARHALGLARRLRSRDAARVGAPDAHLYL